MDAHEQAGGRCEWCGTWLTLGTSAAHLIPRSAVGETSDEKWNLALLCIGGSRCHGRLDDNRALAVREIRITKPDCPLIKRIDSDPRLKAYFEKREARQQYLEDVNAS